MGMVHAYKKGLLKDAPDRVKQIASHISDTDAVHFAETKTKGLPEHVKSAKCLNTALWLIKFAVSIPKEHDLVNRIQPQEVSQLGRGVDDILKQRRMALQAPKLLPETISTIVSRLRELMTHRI
jgi:hypothetical protein